MSPAPAAPPDGPVALVIFDCDGVLVDSEPIAGRALARVLAEDCGLHLDEAAIAEHFVGRDDEHCMRQVERMLGYPPPPTLGRRQREAIDAALAAEVEAVAGVEAVLAGLGLPCCVASNGPIETLRMTLGKTGLDRYFDGCLFSASEVARAKPAPDLFLYAAERMGGVDPGGCLVIEDSPAGVRGAVAAGMRVLGYAELTAPENLRAAGAHRVFDAMGQLPALIAEFD